MPHATIDETADIRAILAMRLLESRHRAGLLQREVAVKLGKGIKTGVVTRWEQGMRVPELHDLVSLADLFGVTVDWLLGRTE